MRLRSYILQFEESGNRYEAISTLLQFGDYKSEGCYSVVISDKVMKEDDVAVLHIGHEGVESHFCCLACLPVQTAEAADECVLHDVMHGLVLVDIRRAE